MASKISVSVIVPIHNGELWIDECFASIIQQDVIGCESLEVSVYNDASTDRTSELLDKWKINFESVNVGFVVGSGARCRGVGYAKNQAVRQSCGEFLCFQDVDDIMRPERVSNQLKAARQNHNCIIGSKFERTPVNSTQRFTYWANTLLDTLLEIQIYTSHGPTVIMPTWFCSRSVFNKVGKFNEGGVGVPEDLIFFYSHLDLGGSVHRVDMPLVLYRYHLQATTFSISEETIWKIRLERLEAKVLSTWSRFCIWNAGKQGRKLYRSLTPSSRGKVDSFCDVDTKKVGRTYEPYGKLLGEEVKQRRIPIVHFTDARAPLVVCVKMDLTEGVFERNLESLQLQEGKDYIWFS